MEILQEILAWRGGGGGWPTTLFDMNEMDRPQASANRLLDIAEVSVRLGVSVNTLYSWVNQRKIPYVKIGRLLRFDQETIDAWIEERKVKPAEFR